MDFLQFLATPQAQTQTGEHPHTQNSVSVSKQLNSQDLYKNIRKGDLVVVVRKKNSPHNLYKGYVGEVREYIKNQNVALVMLHAPSSTKLLKLSIDHFVKWDGTIVNQN
jgi:ribosomal protein L21E